MDDFNFWWYIIAAAIYFFTRGKKKKQQKPSRPGTEVPQQKSARPKSFEELLREITEGPQEEVEEVPDETFKEVKKKDEREEAIRLEGERRTFADDESKRVYEESIKMAEGADLKFEAADKFKGSSLLKENLSEGKSTSYAQELMDGFDLDEAKKAIIYTEIFSRKY